MTLALRDLKARCLIGERPVERLCEQTLSVDVTLALADETAARTDDLADAVDYAALAEKIRAALRAARCRLIERAAAVVCDVCLAERGVRSADVSISKSGCVPGLGAAVATCHREVTEHDR